MPRRSPRWRTGRPSRFPRADSRRSWQLLDQPPEFLDRFGVLRAGQVSRVGVEYGGAYRAAEDLLRPRLGQLADLDYPRWGEWLADLLGHPAAQPAFDFRLIPRVRDRDVERPHGLAFSGVGDAHHGGLRDIGVSDEHGLDLGGRDPLAGHVHHVIGA